MLCRKLPIKFLFLKKMGQPPPLFRLFSVFFKQKYNFSANQCVKNARIWTHGHELSPITTRPGLPPPPKNYISFFDISDAKDVFALLRGHERKVKPGEEPTFTWFKSGQEFDPEDRFKVLFKDEEDTLALVFQHINPEDAGLYTCVASTSTGKISCSAELSVEGGVTQLLKVKILPRLNDNFLPPIRFVFWDGIRTLTSLLTNHCAQVTTDKSRAIFCSM